VAHHFRCDDGDIEDLKLVLSEACANALHHLGDGLGDGVKITAEAEGELLSFEVAGAREVDYPSLESSGPDASGHPLMLGGELIGALFPDAEFGQGPEGPYLRIRVGAGHA
jgi:hypothetical protein